MTHSLQVRGANTTSHVMYHMHGARVRARTLPQACTLVRSCSHNCIRSHACTPAASPKLSLPHLTFGALAVGSASTAGVRGCCGAARTAAAPPAGPASSHCGRAGCEPPVPSARHHATPGARIPVHVGRPSGAACRPSRMWTGVRHRRPRHPAHAGPAAVPDQQRDPGAVPGLYAWLARAARCCGPGGRAVTHPNAFRFTSFCTAACGPRSRAGPTTRPWRSTGSVCMAGTRCTLLWTRRQGTDPPYYCLSFADEPGGARSSAARPPFVPRNFSRLAQQLQVCLYGSVSSRAYSWPCAVRTVHIPTPTKMQPHWTDAVGVVIPPPPCTRGPWWKGRRGGGRVYCNEKGLGLNAGTIKSASVHSWDTRKAGAGRAVKAMHPRNASVVLLAPEPQAPAVGKLTQ